MPWVHHKAWREHQVCALACQGWALACLSQGLFQVGKQWSLQSLGGCWPAQHTEENREMVGIQPCFCPRQLVAAFRALSLNQLTGFSLSRPAIAVAGSGWMGDELLGGLLL